jgi:ribosomal protein S18 acetylase RimI-like enzyme
VARSWGRAGHTDDLRSVDRLIAYDPGAVIVAEIEGRIVGSVIVGWDGWRGSIYRLAVAPSHRRQGLGSQLVGAAEGRLARLGAVRLQAIVVEGDLQATSFWRATDREKQVERVRFVKG